MAQQIKCLCHKPKDLSSSLQTHIQVVKVEGEKKFTKLSSDPLMQAGQSVWAPFQQNLKI